MTDPLMIFLRTVHILSGIIWVGGNVIVFFVLFPRVSKFADAAVTDMLKFIAPMDRWIGPAAVLTVASGITIGLRLRWGVLEDWFVSGWGWAILVAFLTTVAYLVIAVRQTTPPFDELKAITRDLDGQPATAETAGRVRELFTELLEHRKLMPLLIVAAGAMAAARFL